MLKLLKYEWKACARTCLPMYAAVLLLAAVNRLTMTDRIQELMYGIPTALLALLYVAVMVAVLVVTEVILIQRFYKSLLGDEGYLMFTLPVTVSQHIWAKTIIAVVMSIISIAAAVLSFGIIGSGAQMLVVHHPLLLLVRTPAAAVVLRCHAPPAATPALVGDLLRPGRLPWSTTSSAPAGVQGQPGCAHP